MRRASYPRLVYNEKKPLYSTVRKDLIDVSGAGRIYCGYKTFYYINAVDYKKNRSIQICLSHTSSLKQQK